MYQAREEKMPNEWQQVASGSERGRLYKTLILSKKIKKNT